VAVESFPYAQLALVQLGQPGYTQLEQMEQLAAVHLAEMRVATLGFELQLCQTVQQNWRYEWY
jgi:hypothetical protein